MTTRATRKRMKKISLNEFKAWLEGVEELQPSGWAPNADQWVLIRDKIKSIKEEPKSEHKSEPANIPEQDIQLAQPQQNSGTFIPPPPPVGGIPPAPIDMSPAAQQLLARNENDTIKTPDIDTSDGNISSPFV